MGGILIFLAVSVPFLILTNYEWRSVAVFGTAIACALLGFADDYLKLTKRNSKGLSSRRKLIAQGAISLLAGLAIQYIAPPALAGNLRTRIPAVPGTLSRAAG